MSTYYGEYTTVQDVRSGYIGAAQTDTGDDGLLLDLIRATSREIEAINNRHFVPVIETMTFDAPVRPDNVINFDDDVLAVTSLTNGDGTAITTAQYKLYPLNSTPKEQVRLLPSSGLAFYPSTTGDREGAISAAVVTGFHDDYTNAWKDTLATLAGAISSTSATTFTCTTGKLVTGYLIQIDTEWMYVSGVVVGGSDTITVVRGVNGSTAATHLISTAISRWFIPMIEVLTREGVVAFFRLKNNPVGETVQIGGSSFSTPRDVTQYLSNRSRALGITRLGFG